MNINYFIDLITNGIKLFAEAFAHLSIRKYCIANENLDFFRLRKPASNSSIKYDGFITIVQSDDGVGPSN